ncbi:MAG: transposase [Endozoicomonas sp. (ex Botrylloides leachii)]|nr:transposase [Endozoicomonas sp. (ex Botrylloides leachii)]
MANILRLSGYRCLKHFYINHICKYWREHCHELVSYNRFIELIPQALIVLSAFFQARYGKVSSYIDSTGISVCEKSWALRYKIFRDGVRRGKFSAHWYGGVKLHLLVGLVAYTF